jgi:hypothetical protein
MLEELEFKTYLNEGPYPIKKFRVKRITASKELPFDAGSLERESFSEIGEWRNIPGERCDIFFRTGVKYKFLNIHKNPSDLLIFFSVYVFPKGINPTEDLLQREDKMLREAIDSITLESASRRGFNLASIVMNPPQYMIDELQEQLDSR